MFKKGCLYISSAFLIFFGACTIYFGYHIAKMHRQCTKPFKLLNPYSQLNVPILEFELLDSYDSGRCSLSADGEANGVFQLIEDSPNIQQTIQIDELLWVKGPIDQQLKGSELYGWAFSEWDYFLRTYKRPKLPKSIPFLSRKELFESKSFFHLGSCQYSKADEFNPCSDGFLMIYDPDTQLLYVSQFNS